MPEDRLTFRKLGIGNLSVVKNLTCFAINNSSLPVGHSEVGQEWRSGKLAMDFDVRMSDLPINRPLGRGRDPGAHDLNRLCKAFGKQKQICVVS